MILTVYTNDQRMFFHICIFSLLDEIPVYTGYNEGHLNQVKWVDVHLLDNFSIWETFENSTARKIFKTERLDQIF